MYHALVISPLRAGSIALFMLIAGCSATLGSPPDGGADRPTGTDGATDRPSGSDLGVDVGDAPASPWQVELNDGATTLWAVWGSGPNDIYAVGQTGTRSTILHSTGDGKWLAQSTGLSGTLYSVWGSGTNDVYIGGFGSILLHSTGDGTWALQTIPNLGVTGIWGSSASDVYLAYPNSTGNVYHSTGDQTWTALNVGDASSTISAVWGTNAANVFFAGGNGTGYDTPYVVHGPGALTTETIPPLPDMYLRNIFRLWGSGPSDIYAVGNSNQILHSTGTGAWTLQTSPQGAALGGTFEDVWGSGPNDIYIAGNQNGVAHSTGDGTWTIDPNVQNRPHGIWGSGPRDIYVVGDSIVHKKL